MIKRLLEKGYVNSAQARSIELFVLWTIFSLAFWLLDNLELLMNWQDVDWKKFLFVFASTTATAILAWLRKYLRDKSADLLK